MSRDAIAHALVALAPLAPLFGAGLSAVFMLRSVGPSRATMARTRVAERLIVAVATAALALCAVGSLAAAFVCLGRGAEPTDLTYGRWLEAGEVGFDIVLRVDALSALTSLLVSVLVLATSRFSTSYLHRERGFHRFFMLMLLFAAGMQTLVLSGSYDILFAGWEIVGVTSVLLVGFFQERAGPVRASVRVLVTYRACDVGFLFAVVLLHHEAHTTGFTRLFGGGVDALAGTAAALGLVLAAMGKSAQVPVGGWLPRAMEGPTASSAVFYGGLSVHAGVFLLLRSWPLIEDAVVLRVVLVLVGALTAVMGAASSQASADAKSAVAHATISHVGLMFVECGAGLVDLALGHFLLHATLRYYQFLRTPSAMQDALERRAVLGRTAPDEAARVWERYTVGTRRLFHRLAVERFELEAALDRWLVRPLLAVATVLDAIDRRAERALEPASDVAARHASSRGRG